ncbi:tyrosine-type recombinase/integrase [Fibrella aestuarina]|nr:site-specific integrase [Fibrella aestuarina]
MATLSLLLNTKIYSDGTRPLMLSLIVQKGANGTSWKRRTLCRLKPHQWDKARRLVIDHPEKRLLNAQVFDAFQQAEARLQELSRYEQPIDAQYVLFGGQTPVESAITLLAHGRGYVERLALLSQTRTAEKYNGHLNRLAQFLGQTHTGTQKDIALSQVTEKWLLEFSVWLGANGCKSPNTLQRRMAFMTTLLNDARKRGLMHHEPMAFLRFKEQRVVKLKLTNNQVEQLKDLDVRGKLRDARNTFLLQVYAYGARIGDAVNWKKTDLRYREGGAYLVYRTQKTGDILEVKLNRAALDILAEYNATPGPYLLPWLSRYVPTPGLSEPEAKAEWLSKTESATAQINVQLKELARLAGIEGKLTSHVARHTFATLADAKITDKRKISAALSHKRFATTEIYLSELRSEEVNDAMCAVWE